MSRRLSVSLLCMAAAMTVSTTALAADPEHSFSGNLTIGSDYRFRGFTQTDYKPTIQGGIDYAHSSGFYVGNWNSNVSQTVFNGAPIEMDFYGGWKTEIEGFGLDLGVIYYYYPGTGEYDPDFKAKNFEAYIGGSYGPLSVKYSYAFTNFFGLEAPGIDTKGSQYLEIAGEFEVGTGLALVAQLGYQKVKNYDKLGGPKNSVWDYKLGMTWDIAGSGWMLGGFLVGTSDKDFFATGETSGRGAGRDGFVATLSKEF